jgi:hypothetical protein
MARIVETDTVMDAQTGEIIEQTKRERVIQKKAKEGTWVKLFLSDVSRTHTSKGDERTLLGELIKLMDKNNEVDLSPRKKQDIIIDNIYLLKDASLDTEDKNLRAKAGRRFSQLIIGLMRVGIVVQKNTAQYIIDSDYVEYGYNDGDSMTTNQKKANFLTFTATLDKTTGQVRCKVRPSDKNTGGAITKDLSKGESNE